MVFPLKIRVEGVRKKIPNNTDRYSSEIPLEDRDYYTFAKLEAC